MVESAFIYKNAKMSYAKGGFGNRIIFFFHGFGQNHNAFNTIVTKLSKKYTIFSFDLFFHGKSEWNQQDRAIDKLFWKSLLTTFCDEHKIKEFSIAGFSIGCRFVLATAESLPERTKEIFLLAPDGIKNNIWYTLATYPLVLRKLFKSMISKPDRFMRLANLLHKYSFIDRSLYNVALYQMITEEKRKRVYYSWVVFRHLRFSLKKLADVFNKHNIRVTIAIGKHDKIIKPIHLESFLKHLKDSRVVKMETGHSGFLRDDSLVNLFLS